jgi:hypothetical protein
MHFLLLLRKQFNTINDIILAIYLNFWQQKSPDYAGLKVAAIISGWL